MKSLSISLLTCLIAAGLSAQAAAQFRFSEDQSSRLTLPFAGLDEETELVDPVTVSAHFTLPAAGRPALLVITAKIEPGWHIYSTTQAAGGPQKTMIELKPNFGLVAPFRAHPAPQSHIDDVAWVGLEIQEHHDVVTWYAPIELASDVEPSILEIHGVLTGQACKNACVPLKIPFAARIGTAVPAGITEFRTPTPAATVQGATEMGVPILGGSAKSNDPKLLDWTQTATVRVADATQPKRSRSDEYNLDRLVLHETEGSVLHYVLLAFVGGVILNLMPCVLPVIGLKVMSFVQQAGHSRRQALVLNVWYSAGIVSVFLLLGFLATSIGLSWGGQFSSTTFKVSLASIVFAMALSLLGLWEIPIPGFFGSGTAQELAGKEGPLGAFSKGAVTTILATPCTGPFMATAIAWAVTQPSSTTMTVFASLGMGMASPYLIVGVFPQLLRFLPKPGAWMVRFKQLMGIVLLGTVVFIFTFINSAAVVPSVALLVGISIACMVVSQTPSAANFKNRAQSWSLAASLVLLFAVVSFGWLYPQAIQQGQAERTAAPQDADTAWQPFSLQALKRIVVDQGRTALVDFSAEWCLTCKTLEKTVLHTEAIEQAIASTGVVTMYADFTDYPAEIDHTIRALKSNGVPVIALFPGDRPYHPIVFRGAYSKSDILEAVAAATGRPVDHQDRPVRIANVSETPSGTQRKE